MTDLREQIAEALGRVYNIVDPIDEETPVQFVGVYVLRWGREDEPTVGFYNTRDGDLPARIEKALLDCGLATLEAEKNDPDTIYAVDAGVKAGVRALYKKRGHHVTVPNADPLGAGIVPSEKAHGFIQIAREEMEIVEAERDSRLTREQVREMLSLAYAAGCNDRDTDIKGAIDAGRRGTGTVSEHAADLILREFHSESLTTEHKAMSRNKPIVTIKVYFNDGSFGNRAVNINMNDFDEDLHTPADGNDGPRVKEIVEEEVLDPYNLIEEDRMDEARETLDEIVVFDDTPEYEDEEE
jgi:hypothetical protein